MSSFRFPPPPPPPPKASSTNHVQDTYNSQRGGHGGRGGRGDRGRGREGPGRGRGGGYGQGNAHNQAGPRGGSQQQQPGRGGWQNHGNPYGPPQPPYQHLLPHNPTPVNAPSSLPNAYGSYPFANPTMGNMPAPQVDPAAFAQAMSFMATPAGMHSMTAFASHMAGVNPAPPAVPQQSPPPQQAQGGGVKRRRNDRAVQYQAEKKLHPAQNTQQGSQKPPRAKVKVAPAIPTFGFALPTAAKQEPQITGKDGGKIDPRKRKHNLGLTAQEIEDDPESSSDEEIDEEAAYAGNQKLANGLLFEHEGELISLQTQAEIAAWRKDRRSMYPTRKRMEEKALQAKEKRESELEFLARVTGKPRRRKLEVEEQKPARKPRGRHDDAQERPGNQGGADQESMKRNIPTSDIPTTQPSINLSLGYESETDSEADSSELSDSSVLSSDEEESDVDSDSSDGAPVPQTTKLVAPVKNVPPPPPVRTVPQPKKQNIVDVCPQWKKTGKCKYGRNCRHPHVDVTPKMVGLYERMVEQELEKTDRMALDAIKFLGQNGFLG